jgi:hypothetical protein
MLDGASMDLTLLAGATSLAAGAFSVIRRDQLELT